jgi:long-chain acyl-CoA synthetase
MLGYLNDPEQTQKVLFEQEGKIWYRTGDLFSIDVEGFLTFKGRVGRQFKLRNGEFVNPELLERIFARVPLVEHVLVYGDQQRDYPLPLITVDVEEAKKSGIDGLPIEDEVALRQHPELAERIRQGLLAEAVAAGLPGYERPQRVVLLPESLSEEDGTLTKGLKKVVPKVIVEQYRELVEETYRS